MGENCLPQEHMNRFASVVDIQLKETLTRLKYREERRLAADHDAEDEENFQEEEIEEDAVLSELSRAIHGIFETSQANFVPSFELLLPTLGMYMVERTPSCRQW
jgi:hypothetical protein